MHAVAAEQGTETAEAEATGSRPGSRPGSRRRVNSSALDMATRGYLRGQISLEEFTRFFDEYLDTVERRQRTERFAPDLPDATMRLARWMKQALSTLSDRHHTKNKP